MYSNIIKYNRTELYEFFFFNDTATTEIYTTVHTLSLHDALPICEAELLEGRHQSCRFQVARHRRSEEHTSELQSRTVISYAVFCLKKKKQLYPHTFPEQYNAAQPYESPRLQY